MAGFIVSVTMAGTDAPPPHSGVAVDPERSMDATDTGKSGARALSSETGEL
jgi:hypothetical protein